MYSVLALLFLSIFCSELEFKTTLHKQDNSNCVVEETKLVDIETTSSYQIKINNKVIFKPESDGISGYIFSKNGNYLLLASSGVAAIDYSSKDYGFVLIDCISGKIKGYEENKLVDIYNIKFCPTGQCLQYKPYIFDKKTESLVLGKMLTKKIGLEDKNVKDYFFEIPKNILPASFNNNKEVLEKAISISDPANGYLFFKIDNKEYEVALFKKTNLEPIILLNEVNKASVSPEAFVLSGLNWSKDNNEILKNIINEASGGALYFFELPRKGKIIKAYLNTKKDTSTEYNFVDNIFVNKK